MSTISFQADGAFFIGRAHAVCQDYVTTDCSGSLAAFGLLSDGCSSSPDTDIGARLLVRSARRRVQDLRGETGGSAVATFASRAVRSAACHSRALGLEQTCVDATLLGIRAHESRFLVFACGDGVIALGRADGALEVHSIRYGQGYPDYPSYVLSPERRAGFDALSSNERSVTFHLIASDGTAREIACDWPDAACIWREGDCAEYCFAAVLSDGVHSFQTQASPEAVPYLAVVQELLRFKSLHGAFVQRRVQRFQRDAQALGWRNHDDVSLSVVAFCAGADGEE